MTTDASGYRRPFCGFVHDSSVACLGVTGESGNIVWIPPGEMKYIQLKVTAGRCGGGRGPTEKPKSIGNPVHVFDKLVER